MSEKDTILRPCTSMARDYELPIIEGTLGDPVLDIKAVPQSWFLDA